MDKKAKNILFKTYWTSADWTDRETRKTDPEDFEYAKSKGVMFDPLKLRVDWRSGIASYANLVSLLEKGDNYFYAIDEDDDINVLNFERIKWGGVRHEQALYNYFDLKILQTEIIPEPTTMDIAIFENILLVIQSNPTDTASILREKIKNVWHVSKNERDTFLEILGYCGIWERWCKKDKYNKQQVANYFVEYLHYD